MQEGGNSPTSPLGRVPQTLESEVLLEALRRSHIIANNHRHIGKETSRRWEQGGDISMVDFRCTEYSDGKIITDKETRKRIIEMGIRKIAREITANRETIALSR